jgi:hypothetical protein
MNHDYYHNYNYNDTLKYFSFLLYEACRYNKHFKKIDKKTVKYNFHDIISQIKNKYNGSNQHEIINIISSLRLWNRENLPYKFNYDMTETLKLQKNKKNLIAKLNFSREKDYVYISSDTNSDSNSDSNNSDDSD